MVAKGVKSGARAVADLTKKVTRSGGAGRAIRNEMIAEGGMEALEEFMEASKNTAQRVAETLNPMKGVIQGIQSAFGVSIPKNFADLTAEIIKLNVQLDDLQVDVGRSTGLFTQLGSQIEVLTKQNRQLGVTFDRTAKAMMSLDSGFSSLYRQTTVQQQATLRLTFALENLGVAADDTGRGLEVFTRGMASSDKAAQQSVKNLINLAREIRFKGGPAQMMRDIAEIGPMIVKFGSSSEQVMGDLAKHARATGLEMRQIFDVSDQFDTFEGALDKAGQLNAQFGLGLDSIALMQADDAERRDIIVGRFSELYGNFESLDKRQKQIMGETLGFGSDILATRKYFEEMPMFMDSVTSIEQAAVEQTKLSERGQAAMEGVIRDAGDTMLPGLGASVNQVVGSTLDSFKNLSNSTDLISMEMKRQFGLQMMGPGLAKETADALSGAAQIITTMQTGPVATPGLVPLAGAAGAMPLTNRGIDLANATQNPYMTPQGMRDAARRGRNPGQQPAGTPTGQPTTPGGSPFIDLAAASTDVAGAVIRPGMTAAEFTKAMDPDNVRAAREAFKLQRLQKMGMDLAAEDPDAFFKLAKAQAPGGSLETYKRARATNIAKGGQITVGNVGRKLAKEGLKRGAKKAIPVIGDVAFGYMEAEENIAQGMSKGKSYAREGIGATAAIGGGLLGAAKGAAFGAAVGGPLAPVTAILGGIIGAVGVSLAAEATAEAGFDAIAGNEVKDRRKKEEARAALQVQKQAPQKMANSYMQAMYGQQQRQPTEMGATIPLQNVININGAEVYNDTTDLKSQLNVTTGRQPPRPQRMNLPAVTTNSR